MRVRFIPSTVAQWLKLAAWVVALANLPLTIGATLTGVPEWLKWLTPYWPSIFVVAGAIHKTADVFGIAPDATILVKLDELTRALTGTTQPPSTSLTTTNPSK